MKFVKKYLCVIQLLFSFNDGVLDVQWNQSSSGDSASHYSDQSIVKLDFLAA